MPRGRYAKPPITEAVLDVRTEAALSLGDLQQVRRRFAREYPNSEEQIDWNIELRTDPLGRLVTQGTETGRWYKLSSNDQADVLLLKNQNLTISRLSPYQGWEQFFGKAKTNYQIWRQSIGYKKITRVATRYINRFDIPSTEVEKNETQSYFIIRPQLPQGRSPSQFFTQAVFDVNEIGATVILNFGSVPSPLLDHRSFVLDIDLYRDHEIPGREEELWEMINGFREHKNAIFEESITDRARDLLDAR